MNKPSKGFETHPLSGFIEVANQLIRPCTVEMLLRTVLCDEVSDALDFEHPATLNSPHLCNQSAGDKSGLARLCGDAELREEPCRKLQRWQRTQRDIAGVNRNQ